MHNNSNAAFGSVMDRTSNPRKASKEPELTNVKIGFVGVGNMGQCAHLKNYVTLPDCEQTLKASPT